MKYENITNVIILIKLIKDIILLFYSIVNFSNNYHLYWYLCLQTILMRIFSINNIDVNDLLKLKGFTDILGHTCGRPMYSHM